MRDGLSKEQSKVLFEEVANYFSLFSEPTRLKIMSALCSGEKSVNEIVECVESTQANVSRQINMLYRSKVLARRKEGTQVFYKIDDRKTLKMCQTVCDEIANKIGMEIEG